MTVHFRRRRLAATDQLGAVAVGLLAGMGAGAVAFYVTRLFLSREPLAPLGPHAGADAPTPGQGQRGRSPASQGASARTD